MTPLRRFRAAMIALALLASLVAGDPPAASAAWTTSVVSAEMSGLPAIYSEDHPVNVSPSTSRSRLDLSFETDDSPVGIVLLAAEGEQLAVGTYTDVQDITGPFLDHVRVRPIGQHVGCTYPATVRIDVLEWQGQALDALAMTMVCPDPVSGRPEAIDLRINSPLPIAAHAFSADQLSWPRILSGTTSPTKTLTVTSTGTTPLEPSAVEISGTDAADFPLVSDGCSGMVLDQGESCDVVVGFTPADGPTFSRSADLIVTDNSTNGFRRTALGGLIRRPTTLTLVSANNPARFPDAPASIVPVLTPPGAGGRINWYRDGVFVTFTIGTPPGPLEPNVLGPLNLTAEYLGTTEYAPSSSDVLTQVNTTDTTITINVTESAVGGPGVYDLSAYALTSTSSTPAGGTLTVWDDTTGAKLAETIGGNGANAYNLSLAGPHAIRATYTGVPPYVLGSTATLSFIGPPPTVPQAPWQVVATAGEGSASVSWQPPIGTGGSPITGYRAVASPGGRSCTTTGEACLIQGLTVGTSYTVVVTASNALGTGAGSAPSNAIIPVDTTPPTGAVSIASGAALTKTPSVSLAVPAADALTAVTQVGLSNDGSTWVVRSYGPVQSWTLLTANGTRKVWVKWKDAAGNWSAAASDTIVLDTVAPTTTAPTAGLAVGAVTTAGGAPAHISWAGLDATTGVARYEIQSSVDGGAWSATSQVPGTSTTRSLVAGHAYQFRVRAVDNAGNVGSWRLSQALHPVLRQESWPSLSYAGKWTSLAGTSLSGGVARQTSAAGASVTYSFVGRSVGWLSRIGSGEGAVKVYVDGVLASTVDLAAPAATSRQLVFTRTWGSVGTHTIRLVNVGTIGRPVAIIDGFASLDGTVLGAVHVQR